MKPFALPLAFKRTAIVGALATATLLQAPLTLADELRIGYQRSSTLMSVLRNNNSLEEKLAEQGVTIDWYEFTSGLPMLESLNVGNIDISADVADTVPIFAQAAGADLTFYASEAPSPAGQALIVLEDSDIETLEDLAGKRITVTRGAGNHYLLIAALESVGLTLDDVRVSYLPPADARAAFAQGNVDAWIAWEPFLSTSRATLETRTITDGSDGLASYTRYYLAATPYVEANPEVISTVYEALNEAGNWVNENPEEAAELLAPLWGNLDPDIVQTANLNRSYDVQPVTLEGLGEQQKIADAFFAADILPHAVDATDSPIWQPGE
ncbi:aliphatic sulfonate ABC transporter substrate-binding protein [Vreelandella nigrificans]|uniref:Putative aliphatic sulfonates-binding protein n=1 Tax=Vreelandella nigrificans TaxID=2042704 RepID=A0A2A4HLA0_9GAMM|nr:aliphatic sulfonate ABC transporter substrate-binding protein [Halomonas nigrificans]PCF95546.1 ABC transporter substrate-binding protein [Halomonas nigrificans]